MHITLNFCYRISMALPSGVIAKEQTNVFSCKGHFFKNRSQENIQKCSEIQIYKQIHKRVKNTNTKRCYTKVLLVSQGVEAGATKCRWRRLKVRKWNRQSWKIKCYKIKIHKSFTKFYMEK